MAFVKLAELGLRHGLLEPEAVATSAEVLAGRGKDDEYALALKQVWIVAADSFGMLGKEEDANRCYLNAAECTLRMRDQSGQVSVKAHWTKAALGEMRHLPGSGLRVAELRNELRVLQMAAQDDLTTFKTPMDLDDLKREIQSAFSNFSFSEVCLEFAIMGGPPSASDLRELVKKMAREHPLSAVIGGSYYDSEGRETARSEPMSLDGEPSEDWFRAKSAEHMDIVMFEQVRGKIEPARLKTSERFSVQERHLIPIVRESAFIPQGRHDLFALAFARMFQGDYVTAGHILFPQLENSLRHVLMLTNRDPTKIEQDLIQGDRALSALLDVNRPHLEAIFGEDLVYEIDILFNFRPGPALRNELAHGQLPWGAFFQPASIFACWFIFHLVCRPLARSWKSTIAPQLDAEMAIGS